MQFKVLILKPSSLGDIVHALPVLRVLKQHYPRAEIHWWVEGSLASILANDPDLKKIHIFRRRNWGSAAELFDQLRSVLELRKERFDWVIDLQGLARSAWLGWVTGGSVVVGLDSGREGARAFYDISVSRRTSETHAVDWCLDVVRAMGLAVNSDYEWLPKGVASGDSLLDPLEQWVVLCPGARWPSKCWPVDYFVSLVAKLRVMKGQIRIAVLGAAGDVELGKLVSNAAPEICLDLVGKTTLAEMTECLRCARVVVANDSGPLHLAVALNRPTVALYGPTHSGRTGPYGRPNSVMQTAMSCSPCQMPYCDGQIERECMKAISPHVVADAIMAKL